MNNDVQCEINCKCGMKGWIGLGEISDPCPVCGRRYEYKIIKGVAKLKRLYKIRERRLVYTEMDKDFQMSDESITMIKNGE